jgi:hypothetical protein
MNARTLFIVVSVCLAAMSISARGGVVTPISSNRLVSVLNRETLPQTQVSFTGPTLGSWQATAQASNLNFSDPNFNFNGSLVVVTSSQQSAFSSAGVSFSGFVFIDYSSVLPPHLGTSGTNRCDTVFHVEGASDYTFQATYTFMATEALTSWGIFLRNNSTAQTIFNQNASGVRAGTLPTGDYTLSILIQGNSGGTLWGDARTQIDALFSIPAPATGAWLLLLAPIALARRRRASPASV